VSKPIPRLPQRPSSALDDLTALQKARLGFYRFLIKLTRGIGGDVNIVTIPSPAAPDIELVAAILLWCPPYKRNATAFGIQMIKETRILYNAGIISSVLVGYGIGGFHRVTDIYEACIHKMFKKALDRRGSKFEECGFVQMLAMNTEPEYDHVLKGKGLARQLLQWRIDRHWEECKDPATGTGGKLTPVILDTTTDQGIEAYKKLGFELGEQYHFDTGTDKDGFKLAKDMSKEERARLAAEAKERCFTAVMLKMPS
jgi:hypothetical protein